MKWISSEEEEGPEEGFGKKSLYVNPVEESKGDPLHIKHFCKEEIKTYWFPSLLQKTEDN